ncbi:unnamed protein product [Calypogeia fissa]
MVSRRLLLQRHVLHSSRIVAAAVVERCSISYHTINASIKSPSPSSSNARFYSTSLSSEFRCPPHQAVVYETHGAPDRVVKLVEVPGRELHDGEVCVKMMAAPINPSDLNKIEGVYPVRPAVPAVGGNEGVGSVVGMGPGVKNLAVNDWVIPVHSTTGTWSSYVIQNESAWHKVSNDLPIEYLATISINPTTALRMLKDFVSLQPGDTIVQNGATSIVGQCVIQLAHSWGIQTVNIVRDRKDLDDVKQRLNRLGATQVFSLTELENTDKKSLFVDQAIPKLGLNCVGGSASTAVLKLLGEGGTMVTYGGMAKKPITLSTASFIFKDVQLKGFWLHRWLTRHTKQDSLAMLTELLESVRDGKLQYSLEKVPFSSFDSALQKAMGMHGSALKQVLVFDKWSLPSPPSHEPFISISSIRVV